MRRRDWQARLTAYLSLAAREPYAVGRHDCALFAAGAVEAITGHDPAGQWRGNYSTKAGGLRLLKAAGYADHLEATASHLPEIAPAFAAPGDIAILQESPDGQLALGVVQGEVIYVLRDDGLGLLPRSTMTRAFRT